MQDFSTNLDETATGFKFEDYPQPPVGDRLSYPYGELRVEDLNGNDYLLDTGNVSVNSDCAHVSAASP